MLDTVTVTELSIGISGAAPSPHPAGSTMQGTRFGILPPQRDVIGFVPVEHE